MLVVANDAASPSGNRNIEHAPYSAARRTHAHTYTRAHARMDACTCVHVCARAHARMHSCAHACKHAHTCANARMRKRARTCMRAQVYLNSHMHSHMHALSQAAQAHAHAHAYAHARAHARARARAHRVRMRLRMLTHASMCAHGHAHALTQGNATIWRSRGNRPLRTLQHSAAVPHIFDAQVFPAGDRLATLGADGTLVVWDAESGAALQRLVVRAAGGARAIRVLGESLLATGVSHVEGDPAIVWDIAEGTPRHELRQPQGAIRLLEAPPTGRAEGLCGARRVSSDSGLVLGVPVPSVTRNRSSRWAPRRTCYGRSAYTRCLAI